MLDLAKLKQQLVDSGAVDEERLDRAQKYAFEENIPLGEALVTLNILTYRRLGQAFSEIYELPYVGVLNTSPPPHARALLSAKAAVHWKVMPVAFDHDNGILTIAIHDPDQIQKIEKIYRFYLPAISLAFVIVSKVELDKAQEAFYGAERPPAVVEAERKQKEGQPEKRRLFAPPKHAITAEEPQPAATVNATESPATPSGLSTPYKSAFSFKGPPPGTTTPAPASASAAPLPPVSPAASASAPTTAIAGPRQLSSRGLLPKTALGEPSYAAMSQSLLTAAGLIVRLRLAADQAALFRAHSRVRYCQLVAGRLNLSPVQTDAVVLAAWISSVPGWQDLLKEFVPPFKIEDIIMPEAAPGESPRVEAQILSLVRCYQDLQERNAEAVRDLNLARRHLRAEWSGSAQDSALMETFLHILMDEQFLTRSGVTAGSILIVDPSEMAGAQLSPPLVNDGYDVAVVPDSAAAEDKIAAKRPDLCFVAMNLPRENGLKLVQKIKAMDRTNPIPCVIILDRRDEKRSTECLRAGADEVLTRPVDIELLFLKLPRLIKTPERGESDRAGVKGSLRDMAFTDMIQILCANMRSVEIILTQDDPKREAHIFVQNGDIVHAAVDDKQGEDAFYELMRWKTGEFVTLQCKEFPPRTINATITGLLMAGAQILDEGPAGTPPSAEADAADPNPTPGLAPPPDV